MIGGIYGYAVVAAVVAGLSLTSYGLYQRSEAANAKRQAAEERNAQLVVAVKASEETNKALVEANAKMDALLVEQDKRRKAAEAGKRKLAEELNGIKQTLAAEDKSCLDRSLPPAIVERLRVNP